MEETHSVGWRQGCCRHLGKALERCQPGWRQLPDVNIRGSLVPKEELTLAPVKCQRSRHQRYIKAVSELQRLAVHHHIRRHARLCPGER